MRLRVLSRPAFSSMLIAVWIASITYGFLCLTRYETKPGAVGIVHSDWPMSSAVPAPTKRFVLVVFIHPQCSCSRATLSELDRLIATSARNVDTYILFERPAGMPSGWERTALWDTAKHISGTHVLTDINGIEARRFGAETSGQTYLYSQAGHLEFSGGITSMRGHYGDSAGRFAILSALAGHDSSYHSTHVFGCALFNKPVNITGKAPST